VTAAVCWQLFRHSCKVEQKIILAGVGGVDDDFPNLGVPENEKGLSETIQTKCLKCLKTSMPAADLVEAVMIVFDQRVI
jgi:hypothetical protein